MTGDWSLSLGLPKTLRRDAARLYWQAFGPKLGMVLGPNAFHAPSSKGIVGRLVLGGQ